MNVKRTFGITINFKNKGMTMNNKQTFGITVNFNLLTLLFIGLKLTHYINWSWWWVLAPTWIPFAIWFASVILWLIFNLIVRR